MAELYIDNNINENLSGFGKVAVTEEGRAGGARRRACQSAPRYGDVTSALRDIPTIENANHMSLTVQIIPDFAPRKRYGNYNG